MAERLGEGICSSEGFYLNVTMKQRNVVFAVIVIRTYKPNIGAVQDYELNNFIHGVHMK
jgi:hypothetical protein